MIKWILILLRKLGVLKQLKLTFTAKFNGQRFKIPIILGVGLDHLISNNEPWLNTIIQRITRDIKGSFIDVGVNIGQTLLKVKSSNAEMDYIGFEPNPTCIHYLAELVSKNDLQKVIVYPVGLNEITSVVKLNFFSQSQSDSSASIIPNFRPRESIKQHFLVPVFNLLDLNVDFEPASIIKIDVEGAELEVIQSLLPKIKEDRPLILMEILPCYDSTNIFRISRQNKIESIFKSNSYLLFRIIKEGNKFQFLEQIDQIGVHGDIDKSDYMLVPLERESWIEETFKVR
jgi:FkbM family methyltransferase